MTDMRRLRPNEAEMQTIAAPAPQSRSFRPYGVLLLAATASALTAGFVLGAGPEAMAAVREAGPEFTRLMRAMALLKLSMVALGMWLALLRLRLAVTPQRAAGYIAAAAAMAVAPGLIWGMAHVVAGAVLLHGGMVAMAVVAATDRGIAPALTDWIARRRSALAEY